MATTTRPSEPAQASQQRRSVTRTCPSCGHHTLIAKGQLLVCRSCQQTLWRSES
jgi:hypothetical protein